MLLLDELDVCHRDLVAVRDGRWLRSQQEQQ